AAIPRPPISTLFPYTTLFRSQANLKLVDDSLNDQVIVSGVTETEHHEIAVYEGLITTAEAMGEEDVVALLQENLEEEEATLQKRSEEHTSELQSPYDLVCRLL